MDVGFCKLVRPLAMDLVNAAFIGRVVVPTATSESPVPNKAASNPGLAVTDVSQYSLRPSHGKCGAKDSGLTPFFVSMVCVSLFLIDSMCPPFIAVLLRVLLQLAVSAVPLSAFKDVQGVYLAT